MGEESAEVADFLEEDDSVDARPSASDPSLVPSLQSAVASLTLARVPILPVHSSALVSVSPLPLCRPVHLQAAVFPSPRLPFAQSAAASVVLPLWPFLLLQPPQPQQRLFVPVPSVSFAPPIVASVERMLVSLLEVTEAS